MNIVEIDDFSKEPMVWAKENCPSYEYSFVKQIQTQDEIAINGRDGVNYMPIFTHVVAYLFKDERDALLFMLRWSK